MGVRRFLRLLFDKNVHMSNPAADDSLAMTANDALHSRAQIGVGGEVGATDGVYEQIAEGHENYAKSFKKKKR